MFAGGCHPCPSVLGKVVLVPLILFLTPLSRFPLDWWLCPPPGIHHCYGNTLSGPVETGLRFLRASLLGKWVTNQKLFVYRDIKYNKVRWDCFGTL